MSQTHVALIGYGQWGRHVLRDLVSLGCAVTVVSRGGRATDEALAAGAFRVVASVDELGGAVGGLVVATPTTTHADVIEDALALGLPIYVEKPMTDDPMRAARIAEVAPEQVFVMHKWRYHPGVELLGEIARSGELGDVVTLRTIRVGWGNPHGDVDGIWILVPHDLSVALEILGEIPDPRHAVAEVVGGVATGLVGVLGDRPWLAIDSSMAHNVRRREIRLVCSEGVATLADPYDDHVLVTRGDLQGTVTREEERRPISTEFPLLRELRAFVEHVDGGPPPRSSAEEGAAEVIALAELRALAGLPYASVVDGG